MKKLFLATMIAAVSVSAANAAPTVYGRAGVVLNYNSVDYKDNSIKDTNRTNLESFTTRFGVRGSEALTPNTNAIYQLEYGLKLDDNSLQVQPSPQFRPRDTYIGLSNKDLGTVRIGRNTSIDPDYATKNTSIAYDNNFGGAAWNGDRLNNSVVYTSPNYSGLQILGAVGIDENDANTASSQIGVTGAKNEVYQLGATYEPDGQPMKAGASYTRSGDFNSLRVTGGFDVSPEINVGGLYQITDSGVKGSTKENLVALGASMRTASPWSVYGELAMLTAPNFVKDDKSLQVVVGGDYQFTSATTGHVYAGMQNYDAKVNTGDATVINVGTGIIHRF